MDRAARIECLLLRGITVAMFAFMGGHSVAQTATLVVAHDDPDGVVAPGESVRVTATVSWQGSPMFWRIDGGVHASPNLGTASNPSFGVSNPSTGFATILNPGSPVGGSIENVTIQSGLTPLHNPSFIMPPWGMSQGLPILEFEWIAPAPLGLVDFSWNPSVTQPNIWLFPSLSSVQAVPVTTSYFGTTLAVVPAPSVAMAAVLGGVLMSRRRR